MVTQDSEVAVRTQSSVLLEKSGLRKILSTGRFVVALSSFLVVLLLGLGGLAFSQVDRIFNDLTPATAHDLAWKATRGVAELSVTCELGVALGEVPRIKEAASAYTSDADVRALLVRDASGKILFAHPANVAARVEVFRGPPRNTEDRPDGYVAWAPVQIEGTEVGSVGLEVAKKRLEAGADLRSRILMTMGLGAVAALILAAVFVSLYIAPLIRLTERAFIDLEQRTKEALESARLKSEFLANMSHEIRTPMNGVIGMAELLQKTPLTAKQRRYSRTITTSASALLAIINDILDFSKIEAGKMSLQLMGTDVRHLAEEVAQLHAPTGNAKGIEVLCAISPEVPKEVLIDHDRLRQVLNNLMSNAVKFTKVGNVVLRVWVAEKGPEGPDSTWRIGFSVTDTGLGIAPENQEKIFDHFTQVDGSLTRTTGGTGLGLTISRHLVQLMGSDIQLKSELNKGSCFEFVLSLRVTSQSSALPAQRLPRTLIIDDNPTNVTVLEEILSLWGIETESAHSAEQALEILKQRRGEDEAFGLVLVDHNLNGNLGTDLAKSIRGTLGGKAPRMVLLTSLSHVDKAGDLFDDSLSKPFLQEDLRRVVSGHGTHRSDVFESLTNVVFLGKPKILVAEDNPINREVMKEILDELGIDSDMVENGQLAIDALSHGNYPVILMDCQMPVLDGYEASRKIRARSDKKADVPIIAVTAHAVAGEREKALAAGMSDYVTKPVTVTRLARALARYLDTAPEEQPKSIGELEQQAAEAAAELAQHESSRQTFGPDALDVALHLDLEIRRSKTLISLFRKMVPDQIQAIERAVLQADREELKRAAHKLKGSCLAVGAIRMAPICANLEPMPGTAHELLAELKVEFEAVLAALDVEEAGRA
jgi:two-component system, sensor histidine kinase and response regulator